MKKINLKKVLSVICVLTVMFMTIPVGGFVNASNSIHCIISGPSNTNVVEGASVTYNVEYTGDVDTIRLRAGHIKTNGFTADILVTGTGNVRTITLTNVQGVGTGKSISISSAAWSSTGDAVDIAHSSSFTIHPLVPVVPNKPVESVDTIAPVLNITGPNPNSVYNGQTVTFVANYTDNVGIATVRLREGHILLNGFTADITVTGTGNERRTITLSNIQGMPGNKNITISGGTAWDAAGNPTNITHSANFTLLQTPVKEVKPQEPVQPKKPVETKPSTPVNNKPADWIPNPNTGK